MITTDKDIKRYNVTCRECKRITEIASNQPAGDSVLFMCECGDICKLTIPEDVTGKHLYKMQKSTFNLRLGILQIIAEIGRAMTVRQIFYQAVSRGLVPKDEQYGYGPVQRNILEMRRLGTLPYFYISDMTRRYMKPQTFNGVGAAMDHWMQYYKQDVWANQPVNVEIWLEKDALGGIFNEVTYPYDVPLYIARGFSSESFLFDAAQSIKRIGKPTYVYFFSDYDPSGLKLAEQVRDKLPRFGVDIEFTRVALTRDQINEYNLPTRPTKKGKHSAGFEDESTELDALHPDILHELITDCIMNHISKRELKNIQQEEAVQKDTLINFLNKFRQAQ